MGILNAPIGLVRSARFPRFSPKVETSSRNVVAVGKIKFILPRYYNLYTRIPGLQIRDKWQLLAKAHWSGAAAPIQVRVFTFFSYYD